MARKRRHQTKRGPPSAPVAPPANPMRNVAAAVAAFSLCAAVGAGIGALAATHDRGGTPALVDDNASALTALASDDKAPAALAALAAALVAFEHGGDAASREQARQRLASATTTDGRALHARALLQALGASDATLATDIATVAVSNRDSGVQLADGLSRVAHIDDATRVLEQVALAPNASPHAQTLLARALASSGRIAEARTILERLWVTHPKHVPSRTLAILIAVIDDAREETPQEQALKQKQLREQQGFVRKEVPRPGKEPAPDGAGDGVWRTPAERFALENLDEFDPQDQSVVALVLLAVAQARADAQLVDQLRGRLLTLPLTQATRARFAMLCMFDGDTASADEILTQAATHAGDVDVLAARARLTALLRIPEAERSKRAQLPRSLDSRGLGLPFGRVTLDALRGSGLVFTPGPDIPEAEIVAATLDPAPELEARLAHVGAVAAVRDALARHDVALAIDAVARAKADAPQDVDVAILEARVRLEQHDATSAKTALDAAFAQDSHEPAALVAIVRYAVQAQAPLLARRALAKLKATGFTSPTALALQALLDAQNGRADGDTGADALARAVALAPDAPDTLRATVAVARVSGNLAVVRKAADALLPFDDGATGDAFVRAWLAEAYARRGDVDRALAIADALVEVRAALPDAHYVRGLALLNVDRSAALLSFKKTMALAPGTPVAVEALKATARAKAKAKP